MNDREPALRCYRCLTPASPDDVRCRKCRLLLNWRMIEELRAIDYLQTRIAQWVREGAISPPQGERLRYETEFNQRRLRDELAVQPAVRRLKPKYELNLSQTPQPATTAPPRFSQQPPPFRPPQPQAAPVAERTSEDTERALDQGFEPPVAVRRSAIDVLVDFGTVRLMLYTGALLLAVGVMIWLRDTLRVQLQRPVVQAGLLGTFTLSALVVGATFVRRARNRAETKLIGRGFLLLGSLLFPLNPWFWLRTGLIEDRGNAWLVGLASCAISLAIAFGLGDRIFVFLSYAGALLTAWFLTFKLTGGAAPGAYALAICLVSLFYLHAEFPVERTGKGRTWETFGGPFFLCGHLGIALTVVFYTGYVEYLPEGLYAAFRHFDPTGQTPWKGVGVAGFATWAYFYSAVRKNLAGFTSLGIWSAFLVAVLSARATELPYESWLLVLGSFALATTILGRALAARPVWGPPMWGSSPVFAAIGALVTAIVALPYFWDAATVPWYAALGVLFASAAYAVRCERTRATFDAVFAVLLATFVAAYIAHQAGLGWIDVDLVLCLMITGCALVTVRGAAQPTAIRSAVWLGCVVTAMLISLASTYWAFISTGNLNNRALPLAIATGMMLGAVGWGGANLISRRTIFALGAFFFQWAALINGLALQKTYGFNERYLVFTFAPIPWLLLVCWFVLRQTSDVRAVDLRGVVRAWASVAVGLAAVWAPFLLSDAIIYKPAGFVFAAAIAVLAAVPLVISAVERDKGAAIVEASFGLLLGLISWHGVFDGLSDLPDQKFEWLVMSVSFSLAPFVLWTVWLALRDRVESISASARVFSSLLAVVYLLVAVPIATDSFSNSLFYERLGFIFVALSLGAFGVWRLAERSLAVLWTPQTLAALGLASFGILRTATYYEPAAVGVIAAGAVALMLAGSLARREDPMSVVPGVIIGHSLIAIAAGYAFGQAALVERLPWSFVAICATVVLAYGGAASAGVRGSRFDFGHRDLAFIAAFATFAAGLNAAGLTTLAQGIEPFAVVLIGVVVCVRAIPNDWVRSDGRVLAHVVMGIVVALFLVCVSERGAAAGVLGPVPWTWLTIARIGGEVALFYAAAAAFKDPLSALGSIAALSFAVLAMCEHYHARWSVRVGIFVALGTTLALVARWIARDWAEWVRPALDAAGQILFAVAAGFGVVLVLGDLEIGALRLTGPLVAFALTTGCAWLLARTDEIVERRDIYRVVWIAFAAASYGLLGLRLGFHPWGDSAFYTLPTGALLVLLGAFASRQENDRVQASLLLWLGSLLAAAPLVLHAFENRFVRNISPVGYDMATITTGLVLVATGILLQLRAPTIVGAVVMGLDLFVVVFSQVRWEEVPLFIYLTALGALLFGVSWLLLYRRDALLRLRDRIQAQHQTFRQWR